MGVIRLIQYLFVALVCVGCAGDFPALERNLSFVDVGLFDTPTTADALVVVPMNMDPSDASLSADQGLDGTQLTEDHADFFGVCDRTLSVAEDLLSNDRLPPYLNDALANREAGYGIIITRQPDHGLVVVHEDGTLEFEPTGLSETSFDYAVQTPSGISDSATVRLTQPVGYIPVNPDAPDGFRDGVCSLREAVRIANDSEHSNDCGRRTVERSILVFSGHGLVELGETVDDDDRAATGDLDIHAEIVIVGCGPDATRISAEHRSRVFEIHTDGDLTLRRLRISKGQANLGGGLLNRGVARLEDVSFFANRANGLDALPGDGNWGCGGGGGSLGMGGAILAVNGSNTTITSPQGRCAFEQNRARGGRGGSSLAGVSTNPDGSVRRCGGDGGGPSGGVGGDVTEAALIDGQPGHAGSGGGGGAGAVTTVEAGIGGRGGFGGGGGGGGNTIAQDDAMPGAGGFGAGSGASGPFNGIGGGGGGGAGLGGAIASVSAIMQVTGCRFMGNSVQGGPGGGPQQLNQEDHRGQNGRAYGQAVFSVGDLIGISESGEMDWVRCSELSDEPTGQCASTSL